MKKIFSILTILCLTFAVNSCKDDGEVAYSQESLLLFNTPQSSADVFVVKGAAAKVYDVTFGVLKTVDTDSDVTLVIDPSSTAKEGVDYTIANKTTTIKAGASTGSLPIVLSPTNALQSGKTIKFSLKSNSLKSAGFKQDFTLNVSLTCPVTSFVGSFKNTATYWYDAPGSIVSIVQSPTANKLILKDFFNADITLNYDPATFVVTIPSQLIGSNDPQYGPVTINKSTDASKVSSFNPCTRNLTLYVNYTVSAGSFGNGAEVFEGN